MVDGLDELDEMIKDVERPTHEIVKEYTHSNKGNGKDTVNMYEVDFIDAKDIDTDIFDKKGRSFAVHAFDATTEVEDKIVKIATLLTKEGWVFRHYGNADTTLQNKILEIEGLKVESFLPYKKFNPNIEKSILVNYYERPFNYASKLYGKKYNEIKKGVKSIFANNVHAILGKDCKNPVDFLLAYSPDGRESTPDFKKEPKVDYSKLGTLSFFLKVTDAAGIAVYNIKNPESGTNLLNLIK